VNGSVSGVRGIALVNGLNGLRGTALVNGHEVIIDNGITTIDGQAVPVEGISLVNGIPVVRGVALVNASLISRGTALVNGIALTDEEGDGEEIVNLANMNFMASTAALANGLNSLKGIALVNGLESEDGTALQRAAGTVQEDGSIVFENGFTSRGLALVNGLNYIRGTALVNGTPLSLRGSALVNGSTIDEQSNKGTILVFDATEIEDTTENVGFTPISFVTGTTVGQHWIVPGTYISNNFEISYGLGTLTIEPAPLALRANDQSKTFGEDDPLLTYSDQGLLGQDTLSGSLIRETGEDVADYAILQGSLTAGENYSMQYDSATFSILPAQITISVTAEDKAYDGTRSATVALSDNRLFGSELDITYASALFEDKHVGEMKEVTVLGLSLAGADAGNYVANTEARATATITPKELVISISAEDKEYDGNYTAVTSAFVSSGLVDGDAVSVVSSNGLFMDRNVGTWSVSAALNSSGADAGNYAANTTATTVADITPREVIVKPSEDFLYIREGDPLPVFAFIYSGWIAGDAGNEGYTVRRDSDGVVYDPYSDESAGSYVVTPVPVNENYSFAVETGTLHVNPYGPGTRAVKPVLNCIEEIDTDYFVANFEYKNENDAAVYVPHGKDNMLSGSGIDWENSEAVPTMFEPGGGSFVIFFDGSELSWTVNSRDGDQKASNAANASSSSTKCKGNGTKAASVSSAGVAEELESDQLLAYPNPVIDKVSLSMKDIEHYEVIKLYDLSGRVHPLTSIDKRTNRLEIDMAHLPGGHYILNLVMEDSAKVVQLIKK